MLFLFCAGPAVHKHQYNSNAVTDINLDNVCKKGNTLLWDLVQDEDAVSQKPETTVIYKENKYKIFIDLSFYLL